jgi:hypothetical protein
MVDDAMYLIALLSSVQNSEAAIARNPEVDHVLDAVPQYAEPRLVMHLVGVAAVLRNYLFDRPTNSVEPDTWEEIKGRRVGLLLEHGRDDVPLGLKDACDKVLHHRSIDFPVVESGTTALDISYPAMQKLSLMDCAVLHGERQGRDWIAAVNLFEFAAAVYFATDFLE